MTKLKDSLFHNATKGPYKPPRWIACGKEDGVPFRRSYRSKGPAMALKNKPGVTELEVIRAH